jgi:N-acyl-D-amino-acid deacylase
MTLLPPEINAMAPDEAAARISVPAERERLRHEWFPRVALYPSLGERWPEMITIGHTASPDFSWAHGLTLAEIARRRDTDAVDAALDLLAASRLEANAIMAVRDQRPVSDLGRLISHPAHLGGSDGIFIGAHPHPRARGAFASYLGTFVREHGFLDWAEAVRHLSTAPADRFHLGDRGRIRPGSIADIALIDPQVVGDRATYDAPGRLAEGIEDVLVAGRQVLSGGRLTGAHPGGGVRATPADARDRSPARSDNPPPRKGDT